MKHLLISLFLIIPVLLFSQDKAAENKADNKTDSNFDIKKEPVLSIYSKNFKLKNLSFTREQPDNTGETLETQFQIENLTNVSTDLYIFVIATFESEFITKSSFQKPELEDRNLIKLIQTYPDEVSNYEYAEKDKNGNEIKVYHKYPKNIKAGVDKKTGKPFTLSDTITYHSRHISKFIKNYYYFNMITILIFDGDEKLVFRQNYKVKSVKR